MSSQSESKYDLLPTYEWTRLQWDLILIIFLSKKKVFNKDNVWIRFLVKYGRANQYFQNRVTYQSNMVFFLERVTDWRYNSPKKYVF